MLSTLFMHVVDMKRLSARRQICVCIVVKLAQNVGMV